MLTPVIAFHYIVDNQDYGLNFIDKIQRVQAFDYLCGSDYCRGNKLENNW